MNFSENKENQQKSIAKLKDIADNFDDLMKQFGGDDDD